MIGQRLSEYTAEDEIPFPGHAQMEADEALEQSRLQRGRDARGITGPFSMPIVYSDRTLSDEPPKSRISPDRCQQQGEIVWHSVETVEELIQLLTKESYS